MTPVTPIPQRVDAIDWETWQPVDRGTLLFVVRDDRILLIHKKRGLGAGKINGPGGRIDDGETPLQCALREVDEEVEVIPSGYAGMWSAAFPIRRRILDSRLGLSR